MIEVPQMVSSNFEPATRMEFLDKLRGLPNGIRKVTSFYLLKIVKFKLLR